MGVLYRYFGPSLRSIKKVYVKMVVVRDKFPSLRSIKKVHVKIVVVGDKFPNFFHCALNFVLLSCAFTCYKTWNEAILF